MRTSTVPKKQDQIIIIFKVLIERPYNFDEIPKVQRSYGMKKKENYTWHTADIEFSTT